MLSFLVTTTTDDDDSECEDEEMKSQHNRSAYSLVLVDKIDGALGEEEEGEKEGDNDKELSALNDKATIDSENVQANVNVAQMNNSNEADNTLTNINSEVEPIISSEPLSKSIPVQSSIGETPRSIQSSEPSNSTPRSGARRSGLAACYSFRALPRTPSGTPRGMKAFIRSHTYPKGCREDEEELSEFWDQVKITLCCIFNNYIYILKPYVCIPKH